MISHGCRRPNPACGHVFEEDVLQRKPDASFWRYIELMRGSDPDAALVYRTDCGAEWREIVSQCVV